MKKFLIFLMDYFGDSVVLLAIFCLFALAKSIGFVCGFLLDVQADAIKILYELNGEVL